MHEKNILIKTNNGNLDCMCFYSNTEEAPAVIFYMDAPGIREELRNMCRKIALKGYNVYLPNLFYRCGTEGNYPFNQKNYKNNKIELKKMIDTMAITNNLMIVDDTYFLLQYIKSDIKKNKFVGIIGYCMSGRFVTSCAAYYPETIKATASFYGVDIYTNKKDSPHLLFNKIKGELYLAFAEKDTWVSNTQINKIKESLSCSGINYTLEVYPETEHGFAFPSRSTFNQTAADNHWRKIFALFARTLK